MKEYARGARAEGRVIGLVPTMGALHEGHTALVKRARKECSQVIASVFVNPKQFGPKEDYKKYPRDLEKDAEKLAAVGVDALFAPETTDVYPDGFRTYVHVEGISERLEGRSRPGHFRGVATVVLKLFEIVQPHFAYFGRKDAQQQRDGARSRSRCRNCGLPDCAGGGWPGAFFAECLFEWRGTQSSAGALPRSPGGTKRIGGGRARRDALARRHAADD